MRFFDYFFGTKKKTATVAKERLQLILAHERNGNTHSQSPDYLPQLQRELMAVIAKYVTVNPNDIKVQMDRQGNLEVLEVKIELPEPVLKSP
jgi:cell division topological specificity factor